MTYFDSSALVKRYVLEVDHAQVSEALGPHAHPVTSVVSIVEVRRVIAMVASAPERAMAQSAFLHDLESFHLVELDGPTVRDAALIAEQTSLRSLDAIHLASARRVGEAEVMSFDRKQRAIAATLGMRVLPVERD